VSLSSLLAGTACQYVSECPVATGAASALEGVGRLDGHEWQHVDR